MTKVAKSFQHFLWKGEESLNKKKKTSPVPLLNYAAGREVIH